MTAQRSVLLFATALALGAVAATAEAQPSAPVHDPAAAEVLFRTALDALDKGDWGVACTKFNASMSLDPAVSTLINLAKCHDHEGKLTTAWAELNRALMMNGETGGPQRKADLEKYARGLIAAIEPRLPKLTIVVRERPAGLRITRDGVEISVAALGDALPVDPGAHAVEASAPGYRSETRTVNLAEGKAATVELTLVAMDLAPQEATAATRSGTEPQPKSQTSGRRVGAYVTGGVGLAGLLLGGIMGGLTLAKKGTITSNCGIGGVSTDCNHTGNMAWDSAQKTGLVSTIGCGVGLAGIGTAAVLWLTAPAPDKSAVAVSPPQVRVGLLAEEETGAVVGVRGVW